MVNLCGVGVGSNSSGGGGSAVVGRLAEKQSKLRGESPRETEDGQTDRQTDQDELEARPVGKGKGTKTSGTTCLLVLRMSRSPAPLARRGALVGTNEEDAGLAGVARQRGKRLMMGGERQGRPQTFLPIHTKEARSAPGDDAALACWARVSRHTYTDYHYGNTVGSFGLGAKLVPSGQECSSRGVGCRHIHT
ncbi:hypothetical protein LX32DRAFT_700494 [Colletotrichum zoysiae]|uniref:Uncharacterized protein n=1 Tax=Colletotrichum zoysiae TaxID=1216348 RepID=A0AAD9M9Q9_9PEZI|nr:hypothetical protein LX32DRAFT_700494 [Colletotrichum zoysiae]